MSIKNAPPKWNEITKAATARGAGEWAMRKWLERGAIPPGWKIEILKETKGRIKLSDMEITQAEAAE